MATRHGYHAGADAALFPAATVDGVDLNRLWGDYQALVNAQNEQMNNLLQLISFPTNRQTEVVYQGSDVPELEEATEFGNATGEILVPGYFNIGYSFREFDRRVGFTFKFVRRATQQQMDAQMEAGVAAYRRRVFNDAMRAIFRNTNVTASINGSSVNVYRFYNAPSDGVIPPDHGSTTFDNTHTHYKFSGGSTLTAANLDALLDDFDSHGYGYSGGYQILFLVNRSEGNVIRGFRTAANGGTGGNAGRYDFIASQGAPGQIINTTQQIIGQSAPAATYQGLNVIGSYGNALVIQDDLIPAGYVLALASGGPLLPSNPLGFYQEAGWEGLRLVSGPDESYPLRDAKWWAGFGFGVRHRGAGIVMRVHASAYAVPTAYATG